MGTTTTDSPRSFLRVLAFLLLAVSIGIYIYACTQMVFPLGVSPGWLALFFGWQVTVAWAANPLLFVCWLLILSRRWRIALICSIGASAVALTVFTLRTYSYSDFVVSHTVPITGYGAGFYLWFTSIFLTALAGWVGLLDEYTRVPGGNRAAVVWGVGALAVLVAIFFALDLAAGGWNQP